MSEGAWTIERDEDLTAPYAFMNNTWVAFDDAESLKIKVSAPGITTVLSQAQEYSLIIHEMVALFNVYLPKIHI